MKKGKQMEEDESEEEESSDDEDLDEDEEEDKSKEEDFWLDNSLASIFFLAFLANLFFYF